MEASALKLVLECSANIIFESQYIWSRDYFRKINLFWFKNQIILVLV